MHKYLSELGLSPVSEPRQPVAPFGPKPWEFGRTLRAGGRERCTGAATPLSPSPPEREASRAPAQSRSCQPGKLGSPVRRTAGTGVSCTRTAIPAKKG